MLDSQYQSARQVIRDLMDSGVGQGEVHQLVIAVAAENTSTHTPQPVESHDKDGLPIYDELPDGLITLTQAIGKYKRPRGTLMAWINRGRIRARGRLRAPAAGGGYLAVREADLVAHMAKPLSKGGRPRKKTALP